jgi:hypothetical protein
LSTAGFSNALQTAAVTLIRSLSRAAHPASASPPPPSRRSRRRCRLADLLVIGQTALASRAGFSFPPSRRSSVSRPARAAAVSAPRPSRPPARGRTRRTSSASLALPSDEWARQRSWPPSSKVGSIVLRLSRGPSLCPVLGSNEPTEPRSSSAQPSSSSQRALAKHGLRTWLRNSGDGLCVLSGFVCGHSILSS